MIDYTISEITDRDGDNYVISIKRPDGIVLHILIPIENDDDLLQCWQACDRLEKPLGLNFLTEGHYG